MCHHNSQPLILFYIHLDNTNRNAHHPIKLNTYNVPHTLTNTGQQKWCCMCVLVCVCVLMGCGKLIQLLPWRYLTGSVVKLKLYSHTVYVTYVHTHTRKYKTIHNYLYGLEWAQKRHDCCDTKLWSISIWCLQVLCYYMRMSHT